MEEKPLLKLEEQSNRLNWSTVKRKWRGDRAGEEVVERGESTPTLVGSWWFSFHFYTPSVPIYCSILIRLKNWLYFNGKC